MTGTTADTLPVPPVPAAEEVPGPQQGRRRRIAVIVLLLLLAALTALTTIVIWYLLFRQPINVPLPVIPESKVPAYSTAVYGPGQPLGVAASASGDRIYVTQASGSQSSLVFDASGRQLAEMAPPASTGSSHAPVYVAVDPLTGEVYVSDRLAGAIYIYDRDGAYQRQFTLAEERPGWQPLGLAFDQAGDLYVSDLSGPFQKVLVIDRTARVVRTLGATARLSFPNGVAVDGEGNVYVADSNNGRLLVFDAAGAVRAQVGRGAGQGNLGLPRGVAVDGQGRVHVVDATGQGVFVYKVPTSTSQRLEFVGFVGGQGVSDGQFQFPNSVASDARGRLYVADTFNDRVQVWSY